MKNDAHIQIERSILLLEDDQESALHISAMLHEMGYPCVDVVSSVEKALDILHKEKPDLIISGVQLNGKTDGIDFAEKVKASDLPIILVSNRPDDFTFEKVKSVHPLAFLVKPFDRYTLQGAIELADISFLPRTSRVPTSAVTIVPDEPDTIFVKSNNLLLQVRIPEILYLHAEGNHCTIVTPNKRIVVKMSIPQFSEFLDPNDFIQVHRNYVVRLKRIESISLSHNELSIYGQVIPISRLKFRDDLLRRVRMFK